VPRKPKVWHFLPEIWRLLKGQLKEDDKRWGNTWLNRPLAGQATRIRTTFRDYFAKLESGRLDYSDRIEIWLKIIGNAVIALIREMSPDMFPKKDNDEMAPITKK